MVAKSEFSYAGIISRIINDIKAKFYASGKYNVVYSPNTTECNAKKTTAR